MKTRNPGDVDCTCYRLRQTARLVSRTYDSFLAPCGISIGQFGMLATLAAMNGESISKLADALQMERTTLSRNLLPLERLGYVAISRASHDVFVCTNNAGDLAEKLGRQMSKTSAIRELGI